MVVGDPTQDSTEMGPLISESHLASVASFVPDDAPVAFRGTLHSGPGNWFAPNTAAKPIKVHAALVAFSFV